MDPRTLPIIKLEVEGMKYVIQTALTQHTANIDEYVQRALDLYCSEDYLREVVANATKAALETAIKSEIERFFTRGAGAKAVELAVEDAILSHNSEILKRRKDKKDYK